MARQRFATPIIQLPAVPPEVEPLKRALEVVLAQITSAGILRAHEINMVNPLRGGAAGGAFLPTGTLYADQDYVVRMVSPDEQWVMPKEMTLTVGGVTAI